jgi:hypothetical protein
MKINKFTTADFKNQLSYEKWDEALVIIIRILFLTPFLNNI